MSVYDIIPPEPGARYDSGSKDRDVLRPGRFHSMPVTDTDSRTEMVRRRNRAVVVASVILTLSLAVMVFNFPLGSVFGMPAFAYLMAVSKGL